MKARHLPCLLNLSRVLAGLALLASAGTSAFGQATAFTYQGRLNDSGGAATGNYDLRFALYDAVTNGNQVAAPLTNSPVNVSNGLFTVLLNFGAGVFTGTNYWLEIGVRTNGSVGAFSTLAPRQAVSPVPYAMYAMTPAGPPGPQGVQGLTGTQGVQGVQGVAGPQGSPGVLNSAFARGSIGNVAVNTTSYVMVGTPTSGLALTAGQKVFISVSAMLGINSGSDTFNFSPGYTLNGGAVTLPYPFDYMIGIVTSTGGRHSFGLSQIFTVPSSGTYVFGFAIQNGGISTWTIATG